MKKLTRSDRACRDRAYLLLASQYGQNPDFMEDFSQLVRGHCPILQYLSNPATGMWPNGLNPVGLDMDGVEAWWNCLEEPAHCRTYRARPGEPDSDRMLREVAEDARILAQDWGLRAPWGPGLVLQNGIQSFFGGRRRPIVCWLGQQRTVL